MQAKGKRMLHILPVVFLVLGVVGTTQVQFAVPSSWQLMPDMTVCTSQFGATSAETFGF